MRSRIDLYCSIEEGSRGLFRGFSASIITVPLFWATYFPIYEALKVYIADLRGARDAPGPFEHVLSAIGAGIVVDVVTSPLWVIRTRLIFLNQPDGLRSIRFSEWSHSTFTL